MQLGACNFPGTVLLHVDILKTLSVELSLRLGCNSRSFLFLEISSSGLHPNFS